jgi:hypothetical protein
MFPVRHRPGNYVKIALAKHSCGKMACRSGYHT